MTTLDELQALIGAPSARPPDVNLETIESEIGLTFPVDYKEFVNRYPALIINNFLHVASPTSVGEHGQELNRQLGRNLEALRDLRQSNPRSVPYSLYPEPGGLYPWGMTDNGDWLFWLTAGAPDTWPTIGTSRSGWAEYAGTMTEFLVGVLRRTVSFELFPSDFPSSQVTLYEYE